LCWFSTATMTLVTDFSILQEGWHSFVCQCLLLLLQVSTLGLLLD
jgi:hypothetical protein